MTISLKVGQEYTVHDVLSEIPCKVVAFGSHPDSNESVAIIKTSGNHNGEKFCFAKVDIFCYKESAIISLTFLPGGEWANSAQELINKTKKYKGFEYVK